ncbi:MAG: hypothetical protein ACRDGQ_13980 [Candidatus Limnocylindrales bacterium]
MTRSNSAPGTPVARSAAEPGDAAEDAYQPGICNIGPAEIARRRRAGDVGLLVTIIVLVVLVVLQVPSLVRLLVALPAAGAASGYLQAALKFCAGFGSRGIFNFGPLGATEKVAEPSALARDRARSSQIFLGSLAIGLAVGVVAVILPV